MTNEIMKTAPSPEDYLARPYARTLYPENDGTFRAEISEFPGCIAIGETRDEALSSLEAVAESWLESALAKGLSIPDPVAENEYSGKLVLRLPKSLHRLATFAAKADGVSLNQLIVSGLSFYLGHQKGKAAPKPNPAPVFNVNSLTNNYFVAAGNKMYALPCSTEESSMSLKVSAGS